MLVAAFISRSNTAPHSSHTHVLSESISFAFLLPQWLHNLLLGKNLLTFNRLFPYHNALYSNICTKVNQLASDMSCAKQWFLTILLTAKSSTQIVSYSLISLVDSFCKKSLRWLKTFSYCLATLTCCFTYLLLPLTFLLNRLCALARFFKEDLKYFGLSTLVLLESVRYVEIPKSTPIACLLLTGLLIGGCSSQAINIDAKYLPVFVLVMVTVLTFPLNFLCKRSFIPSLNFGIYKSSLLKEIFAPLGHWKDCLLCFDLNFGNPYLYLKKFLYAVSRFLRDACSDKELVSFNHVNSFLSSVNWSDKSLYDKAIPCLYAHCLASSAKLYTSLVLSMCFCNNKVWLVVGYIRYLQALYTTQRYNKKLETN